MPSLDSWRHHAPAGGTRRVDDVPPRGGKDSRLCATGIPAVTVTGYPLLKELKKRRKQALREPANGTNLEALLFPPSAAGCTTTRAS